MPHDNNQVPTDVYFKNRAGAFLPIVDTRCCGCGKLVDVAEEIASYGDTSDIGASRHERDSRNGYDLFHRRCPDTDIQNRQLATREEYFSRLQQPGNPPLP